MNRATDPSGHRKGRFTNSHSVATFTAANATAATHARRAAMGLIHAKMAVKYAFISQRQNLFSLVTRIHMSSLLTHASLMKLSKSDLQDKCDASNVRRSGNKDALVE